MIEFFILIAVLLSIIEIIGIFIDPNTIFVLRRYLAVKNNITGEQIVPDGRSINFDDFKEKVYVVHTPDYLDNTNTYRYILLKENDTLSFVKFDKNKIIEYIEPNKEKLKEYFLTHCERQTIINKYYTRLFGENKNAVS